MWLASYVVHLRHVHWRAGADWMHAHLLDGDLGANHLSWQWVAATFSAKPYVFDAGNVARYAPRDWHCAGTVVDRSYEALDAIASARPIVGLIYADDAVRWWGRRNGWTRAQVADGVAEVSRWQTENGIDVSQVIRVIRQAARKERS